MVVVLQVVRNNYRENVFCRGPGFISPYIVLLALSCVSSIIIEFVQQFEIREISFDTGQCTHAMQHYNVDGSNSTTGTSNEKLGIMILSFSAEQFTNFIT